jgi:hypothetical protein
MERHYKHLNAEERAVILAEHQRGSGLRQIGLLLGRHHGTIGLELTRDATPDGYEPRPCFRTLGYFTVLPSCLRQLVKDWWVLDHAAISAV